MREFTVADIPGVPADFLAEGYYYQNNILYRKQTDLKKEVNPSWPIREIQDYWQHQTTVVGLAQS